MKGTILFTFMLLLNCFCFAQSKKQLVITQDSLRSLLNKERSEFEAKEKDYLKIIETVRAEVESKHARVLELGTKLERAETQIKLLENKVSYSNELIQEREIELNSAQKSNLPKVEFKQVVTKVVPSKSGKFGNDSEVRLIVLANGEEVVTYHDFGAVEISGNAAYLMSELSEKNYSYKVKDYRTIEVRYTLIFEGGNKIHMDTRVYTHRCRKMATDQLLG